MLKTFRAWLKGSRLEWIDDVPTLGEQQIPVHVTLLENESVIDKQTRGQRMAEILEKLAGSQAFTDVDPVIWQQETRQDRSLPGR
ncbi:hypothetical protein NIES4072_44560 [Nostoc commune NIES-4072]|uniref:Uncharacterized protein n=1 Tax=Nostoc commune NIES-4072 TaxID=2005467 RepID=A0A2R5FYP2_NOSCO|nr:hypothetical protein [Nostoc commune]BBD68232.1 hypothetical protein NIES4070_46270 [Nostoc commune HK-02]GBG20774.1 hypothetical protein NIES4072_44560 [Nostoc commune NIES-4072]